MGFYIRSTPRVKPPNRSIECKRYGIAITVKRYPSTGCISPTIDNWPNDISGEIAKVSSNYWKKPTSASK